MFVVVVKGLDQCDSIQTYVRAPEHRTETGSNIFAPTGRPSTPVSPHVIRKTIEQLGRPAARAAKPAETIESTRVPILAPRSIAPCKNFAWPPAGRELCV
jgi:hypothetical protein